VFDDTFLTLSVHALQQDVQTQVYAQIFSSGLCCHKFAFIRTRHQVLSLCNQ